MERYPEQRGRSAFPTRGRSDTPGPTPQTTQRLGKRKLTPHTRSPSPSVRDTSPPPTHHVSSCRYDSSLGMLTKKFINLIEETEDGILDLNKAADTLQVQKRRIYDITNVLEGIGLIEKRSKNNIQWKGASAAVDPAAQQEEEHVREEIGTLMDAEQLLEEHVRVLSDALKAMTEQQQNKSRLYVTDGDITSLPCFANDTIFAVRAPQGTTLEVPDPEMCADSRGQLRYRIVLRSTQGPVDVYLVQHPQQAAADGQPAAAPAAPPHEQSAAAPPLHQQHAQHMPSTSAAAAPAAAPKPSYISPMQHLGIKQEPGVPHGVSPRNHSGFPTPLNFRAYGLDSPVFTPSGIVSPGMHGIHKMMEIDPDNWFSDPADQNGYPLQEFFKDDHSIFADQQEEGGVFA